MISRVLRYVGILPALRVSQRPFRLEEFVDRLDRDFDLKLDMVPGKRDDFIHHINMAACFRRDIKTSALRLCDLDRPLKLKEANKVLSKLGYWLAEIGGAYRLQSLDALIIG